MLALSLRMLHTEIWYHSEGPIWKPAALSSGPAGQAAVALSIFSRFHSPTTDLSSAGML